MSEEQESKKNTEIRLVFQFELQDFMSAQSLATNIRRIPAARLLKYFGVFIFALFLVFSGVFLYFNFLSFVNPNFVPHQNITEYVNMISSFKNDFICLSFLFAVFPLMLFTEALTRFRYWSMLRKNPELTQKEHTILFSDKEVNFVTPSVNSTVKWDYFKYIIEGRRHYLLTRTKNDYYIIPKRGFSESSDEEEFRKIATNNLGSIHLRDW